MSVHHASDENNDAVDFKKSIAAAFQANFKGTEQEEEDDPQSDHIAHYRYIFDVFIIMMIHNLNIGCELFKSSTIANKLYSHMLSWFLK